MPWPYMYLWHHIVVPPFCLSFFLFFCFCFCVFFSSKKVSHWNQAIYNPSIFFFKKETSSKFYIKDTHHKLTSIVCLIMTSPYINFVWIFLWLLKLLAVLQKNNNNNNNKQIKKTETSLDFSLKLYHTLLFSWKLNLFSTIS